MSEKLLFHQDSQMREAWWKIYKTGEYEIPLEINDANKLDFLKTIYGNLYGELRDVHARQQQIVGWGFTILTGGGFITLALSNSVSLVGVIIFSIALTFLTIALTRTLSFMSEDRMSIARQIDRMHQIMGAFKKDFYCKETTLLDPIWYGWGFDKGRDANWDLMRFYQLVLWVILVSDVLVLVNKAGLIALF